jgi:hypothetical protein
MNEEKEMKLKIKALKNKLKEKVELLAQYERTKNSM